MGVAHEEWIEAALKYVKHAMTGGTADERIEAAHLARTIAQLLDHSAAQMAQVMPTVPTMPAMPANMLDALLPMLLQQLIGPIMSGGLGARNGAAFRGY